MQPPERATGRVGGPYPEEILLEAYNLEWESIELRRQRLQKTWQQFLLMEEMELEESRYQHKMRRLKRQEQERLRQEQEREKQQREQAEREAKAEALRRQREKEAALSKEKERAELQRQKKVEQEKQQQENDSQPDEELEQIKNITKPVKVKTKAKPKVQKKKKEVKQEQKVKVPPPKRITPTVLPPAQPEDGESASVSVPEDNQDELGGYDSPLPELRDDGLLNMLDKSSDSDNDDEPSVASLILATTPSSPKAQPSPVKKKMLTPQKRFAKKKGGPSLDFNFSNAEAKRQAKAAEAAARAEDGESDGADTEPEPIPAPSTPTPKKRLKRRKDALKEKATSTTTINAGANLMAAMANTTVAVKPKKSGATDKAKSAMTANNEARKAVPVGGPSKAKKSAQGKTKPPAKEALSTVEDENVTAPAPKKKVGGKTETMSIKQRLANAELLARMNKMQDISTPKVLGKKTKKTQGKAATKSLAAKRADFRKVLQSDAADVDVPQRNLAIDEGDLNISLNSSGLISDNDSPENLRAPTRKRPRGTVDGDVTPTKKLQFLEITKRLVKSPMPRFLRTPTPLMSPVVASALVKPKAASPGPRASSARSTAAKDYSARRVNSAPVRPKKTANANRFGIPAGGASSAVSGGGFSMFDAFVNSGSSGAIPRLKPKARGDGSPTV
ncbi:uncharacterized protein IUM83_00334 [Phytophthora cinnamomi]|uniref:uncharacterized protein n=1 Tax=Phytophthora cinnamomi TaxID=4785 RepID=UPI00355987E1|nr:hypothetical protein IUM83_00334 [Phytophthora cinnamomi]